MCFENKTNGNCDSWTVFWLIISKASSSTIRIDKQKSAHMSLALRNEQMDHHKQDTIP